MIVIPEAFNGDSLGSAIALNGALQKLGKFSELVCNEEIPEKLKFMPGLETIKKDVSSWRDFIISIDTSKNKISRLRYENEDRALKIYLTTPRKIEEQDIKFQPGDFYYDLVITIDSPDLESLGKIFEDNTELFFGKPILNIDHKSANEYFGEVNLVEPTNAACAEVCANFIQSLGPDLIDETAATGLLTGILFKTRCFQNFKTTPQTLNLASLLITKGAAQEKIVQNLYKIKPLNRLRLWGKLLSRLDYNENSKTAWLFAKPEDFSQTQTVPQDLTFILEEINDLFPQITIGLILWQENDSTRVLAQARQPELLQTINLNLGGTLKNDKLLLKLPASSPEQTKAKISNFIPIC